MWRKEFEKGRFNGHELNIVSTSFDGGQRVQVSELPYIDQAHIKALGASATNLSIEVVMIGESSLQDTNALIAALNKEPQGTLEHPYAGEIELCFKTYSQKISTKRGLVNLSLSFVRTNNAATATSRQLKASTSRSSHSAIKQVEKVSAAQFADDVKLMSLDDIIDTQNRFNSALDELISITSRLNISIDSLHGVNSAINQAFNAVSGLSTDPLALADSVSDAFYVVGQAVKADATMSDMVDPSRAAQKNLLSAIDPKAPAHLNTQLIVGAVEMNRDVAVLESADNFDLLSTNKNADLIVSDLDDLIHSLSNQIDTVTSVATVESLQIYDALVGLVDVIQRQKQKAIAAITPTEIKTISRYLPALSIAHDSKTDAAMLRRLNPLMHPLFVKGEVALGGVS